MEHSTDTVRIRAARAGDRAFILGLVPRFVAFELPSWRDRDESADGIRRKLEQQLARPEDTSHVFVAETAAGAPAGFLHLEQTIDFFTGAPNCHISDLAVAPGMDGRGLGGHLLDFAARLGKAARMPVPDAERLSRQRASTSALRAPRLWRRAAAHGQTRDVTGFSHGKAFGLCCPAPAAGKPGRDTGFGPERRRRSHAFGSTNFRRHP